MTKILAEYHYVVGIRVVFGSDSRILMEDHLEMVANLWVYGPTNTRLGVCQESRDL